MAKTIKKQAKQEATPVADEVTPDVNDVMPDTMAEQAELEAAAMDDTDTDDVESVDDDEFDSFLETLSDTFGEPLDQESKKELTKKYAKPVKDIRKNFDDNVALLIGQYSARIAEKFDDELERHAKASQIATARVWQTLADSNGDIIAAGRALFGDNGPLQHCHDTLVEWQDAENDKREFVSNADEAKRKAPASIDDIYELAVKGARQFFIAEDRSIRRSEANPAMLKGYRELASKEADRKAIHAQRLAERLDERFQVEALKRIKDAMSLDVLIARAAGRSS